MEEYYGIQVHAIDARTRDMYQIVKVTTHSLTPVDCGKFYRFESDAWSAAEALGIEIDAVGDAWFLWSRMGD